MKERLVLGLISIIGLVIMLIGGTMQSSFISGTMFIVGLLTFGTFAVWTFEKPFGGFINFDPYQKSQK